MSRAEMLAIMRRLDDRANALLLAGADDVGLLVGMIDDMPDFKALLDSPYKEEIEMTGARFPGFYRYATVLSDIARSPCRDRAPPAPRAGDGRRGAHGRSSHDGRGPAARSSPAVRRRAADRGRRAPRAPRAGERDAPDVPGRCRGQDRPDGVPVPLLQKVTVTIVVRLQWFAALHKITRRFNSVA
jgi:hypothetical protein